VLFREQRGSLEDSMKTVVDLPATRLALFCHLHKLSILPQFRIDDMVVEHYCEDHRIGWTPTYIAKIKGQAVGFTNGPVR
jgi:hypothetical protein